MPDVRESNSDETQLLTFRPSVASIVIQPLRPILIFVAGFALLWYFVPASGQRNLGLAILLGLLIVRVIWQAIWRACALYELTTRRVRATTGIFSRFSVEIPLGRVQNTFLSQSLAERLASIGTVGIASAGTDGIEMLWTMIDSPHDVLARVRAAAEQFNREDGLSPTPASQSASITSGTSLKPLPVIGLVGGIGAGKSTVARAIARHGAIILDSDSQAKELLERPDVQNALAFWWGESVLRDGRIDRKKVADIVFADAEQRRRLEGLLHPMIKASRQQALEAASARGVPFAVIDAPLLLEAGVDKECDAVVYVDAPREARLARVRSRGWDDAELDRREAAQLPLQEKRARSHFVVTNDGDEAKLNAEVRDLLEKVRSRFR